MFQILRVNSISKCHLKVLPSMQRDNMPHVGLQLSVNGFLVSKDD